MTKRLECPVADQAAVKGGLHRIMNVTVPPVARSAADREESVYATAVACLRANLDDPLTSMRCPIHENRNRGLTTPSALTQLLTLPIREGRPEH